MPQYLSPIGNDQFIDANGDPLVGGQIETYLAGSSTPAATYTSSSGSTPQSNPIILNSLGYPTLGAVWLTGGVSYKFIIKDSSGSVLRTIEEIAGVNDATLSQSEWLQSGFVPTYIGATSFSVPGDQTGLLQINRRLRTTNTAGFRYSTITNSVFSAGNTTVTVVTDTGSLDAGLSSVEYGLLSASPIAVPTIPITSGGTGQTTAALAFAAIKQDASETATGVVERLTIAEAQAGLDTTRYHSAATMKAAQIVLGTSVSASGTSVDFTSIPSWANRVNVMLVGLSGNGTSNFLVQLGSGSVQTTGYTAVGQNFSTLPAVTAASSTAGFPIIGGGAGVVISGNLVLSRQTGNVWVAHGVLARGDGALANITAGSVSLSGVLDRVRLTHVNGTDAFDAGTANYSAE